MTVLSDRLQALADLVPKGSICADIGTDHGALPLYLVESGRCPSCIMTDISEASLAKAKMAAHEEIRQGLLSARAGDGLAPLEEGEADVVVMAGLGGNLMIDILEADPAKAESFSYYLLQPRKSVGRVRCYLAQKGYRIGYETIIRERRHLCEILLVASPKVSAAAFEKTVKTVTGQSLLPAMDVAAMPEDPDDIRWEIPSYIRPGAIPLAKDYLDVKNAREERNLAQRKKAKVIDPEKIKETEDNLAYLARLEEKRG